MDVILIEKRVYRELLEKIDRIERFVANHPAAENDADNLWLDNETVCAYLKVSKRTLQRYRSNGVISYSIIGRKTYYSLSAIQKALRDKHIRRDDKSLEELVGKGRIKTSE